MRQITGDGKCFILNSFNKTIYSSNRSIFLLFFGDTYIQDVSYTNVYLNLLLYKWTQI